MADLACACGRTAKKSSEEPGDVRHEDDESLRCFSALKKSLM
jgi:hypothetical protein